jgi:hypothetical protein
MICITDVNQLDFKFGLNFASNHLGQCSDSCFASGDELRHIIIDNILDVSHAIEGLGGRGGIDINLNRSLPSGANIRLEHFGGISMT